MQADAVLSGGGIRGSELARGVKSAYTEREPVGGTSAVAIPTMALAIGHNADGLAELINRDASTIDDRGARLASASPSAQRLATEMFH